MTSFLSASDIAAISRRFKFKIYSRWLAYVTFVLVVCVIGATFGAKVALADNGIMVLRATAESKFPDGILFKVKATSDNGISSIVVKFKIGNNPTGRYDYFDIGDGYLGSEELEIEHLVSTNTQQTYIPPGSKIAYHFEITDFSGNLLVTDTAVLEFMDARFEWSEVKDGIVSLFYYGPVRTRAEKAAEIAMQTVNIMSKVIGIDTSEEIRLVMYNNNKDMLVALPYSSSATRASLITEGIYFGGTGILLLLGDNTGYRGVASHEVIHVLVDRATENAYVEVPAWLNEGLAEFGNMEPSIVYDRFLVAAITTNTLAPVTSMNRPPGTPEEVMLFYGQSRSIVDYLIETYGIKNIAELFDLMDSGYTIDQSMNRVYGFDRNELDQLWRDYVGAANFEENKPVLPTMIPLPTIVPFGATPSPTLSSEIDSDTSDSMNSDGQGGGFLCSPGRAGESQALDGAFILGIAGSGMLVYRVNRRRR